MQYAPVAQIAAHLSLRQPRSVRYQQPLVSGALLACWIRYMRSSLSIHGDSPLMPVASPTTLYTPAIAPGPVA